MSLRLLRSLLLLVFAAVLVAVVPGTAAARESRTRHGSVDPYLKQRARATGARTVPVLIHAADRSATENAVQSSGGRIYGRLKLGNTVVAEVPADQLDRLADQPGVARVAYDPPLQLQADPLDTWSQRLASVYPQALGATTAWSGRSPVRGQGVGVAVLDSGINANHPDFRGIGSSGGLGASRLLRQFDSLNGASSADDHNGHGTFVAGIIGGRGWGASGASDDGRYLGIAPEVNLVGVKVSDRNGMAHVSSVVEAIEWVVEHRRQYNIRVLNLSLVSTVADSYATSVLDAAVEFAWYSGIVVVVAAGNAGPGAPITSPANDPLVITVGATDDFGTASTSDDRLAAFSSFGTTRDGLSKPDLVAPGRHIVSTLASRQSALAQRYPNKVIGNHYVQLSGTSAAAPMVAGVVAQILQARPRLEPGEVKWLLEHTARAVPGPGTGAGYPRLDAALRYSGGLGNADRGVAPNRLLVMALASLLGRSVSTAVAWDTVAWDTVAWDTVAWDSVAWDSVAWDSVAWDTVAWDTVAWDTVAGD